MLTCPSTALHTKEPFYSGCVAIIAPPCIMFVKFFHEKYLPAMGKYIIVIPTRLQCVAVEAPDEKLKSTNWALLPVVKQY